MDVGDYNMQRSFVRSFVSGLRVGTVDVGDYSIQRSFVRSFISGRRSWRSARWWLQYSAFVHAFICQRSWGSAQWTFGVTVFSFVALSAFNNI